MTATPLDVLALPIDGTQFIEAGAGTGKTHTICNLFVRLVVETGRPVDSILVLTFTRAATAELRERIESRLRQLANALRGGHVPADDAFAIALLQRIDDVALVQRRLDLALAGFDAAPVHTIHGFCQRALGDHALLSRSVFAAEMLEDEAPLRHQIARDFWRREISGGRRLFVEHVLRDLAAEPSQLLGRLGRFLAKPYLRIRGGEVACDCDAIEQAYEIAFLSTAQSWQAGRDEIARLLLESDALKRNQYRLDAIPGWLAALDEVFAADAEPTVALPGKLEKLTPDALAAAVKKGHAPPSHRFFRRCETLLKRAVELRACHRRQAVCLQRSFVDYCNSELPSRKYSAGVQSFDDLLGGLHAALLGEQGVALRESLRRQYTAALIDEFQDTDPLQYEIFRAIYGGSDQPLYLVGDPKQAIYAFRGADVYAYLRARRELGESVHALTVNWRSDPPLIEAVNALFAGVSRPFRDAAIAFHPASPAPRVRPQLLIDGRHATPLILWMLARDNPDRPLNKGEAEDRVTAATATEIARLLGGDGQRHALRTIDGEARPLTGGDIAVLVRTNAQGVQVRQALAARGIDSVDLAESSVFDTLEAEALVAVLRAVAAPGNDRHVRAALATELLRDADADLYAAFQDEGAWERAVLRFDDYHRRWRDHGFFAMWQHLVAQERVLERLLARVAGVRRVTNLLHLVELIQAEAAAGHGGVTTLVDWLVEQRREPNRRDEPAQLRLESDAELVRIVTIHRSKGLEYPIVFCPFLWDDGVRAADGPVFFHDRASDDAPTLQLDGDDAEALRQAGEESRAESMRLLYVALTRARHRCYVAWGAVKSAADAAPAWLLHRRQRPDADDTALEAWFARASDADIRSDLAAFAAAVPGAVSIEPLPTPVAWPAAAIATAPAPLAARTFAGRVPTPWRLTSYSALVRQANEAVPDHDAGARTVAAGLPVDAAAPGILAFPRGAQAGSCLHAIFEHIDFTDRGVWNDVTVRELRRHGFAAEWRDAVVAMLDDVCGAPLLPTGPRLGTVSCARRVNEFEFHYPFRTLDPRALATRLAPFDDGGRLQQQLTQIQPERVGGYLKGFIDMVFEADGRWYLVDYKSNWLGPRRDDYSPARLAEVMAEECYALQYLLYLVALHRWLRQRKRGYAYERDVGGVFYLFVRAVGPGGDAGIFADRPPAALIEVIDDYLSEGSPR